MGLDDLPPTCRTSVKFVESVRTQIGYRMTLTDLKPAKKPNVIDLLQACGHEVSAWAFRSDGITPIRQTPAQNGGRSYAWAFEQDGRPSVLNLWWNNLEQLPNGRICQKLNLKKTAARVSGPARKRAVHMDNALQRAFVNRVQARVIINDRDGSGGGVDRRLLDRMPWAVSTYDSASGDAVVERGIEPPDPGVYEDQFSAIQRREVTSDRFVRCGAEREAVLARAKGVCELCGRAGFLTPRGALYLETHHVVALGIGGDDKRTNMVALCAEDHRRAHYATDCDEIKKALVALLAVRLMR